MIITCKKEVPFRWIAFAIMPWAGFTFKSFAVSVAFVFSLKKFVENPAGLTFILSLPSFVSLVLQPVISFLSDRIWTRFGRRKPFVVTSLIGCPICLSALPLMPNFWALLAVFMVYNLFADLNSPMEPFKQEIIPPAERGRASGVMAWCNNLACLTFYFIALGRFDDVRYMEGVPVFGEEAIYWTAGLLLCVVAMLVMLGIHEVEQKSSLRGQRLSVKIFFGGLFDGELWPVYLLVVGAACMNFNSGLGALSNLLYTDQWGYTKQEMGINIAAGGIINIFAIGLLTVFADRFNRMRAYQTLISLSVIGNAAYYLYVNFVLPDKRPTLIEIIAFGETLSILGILTSLVYVPMVYDYVRRNKMGTYNAGATMVGKLTALVTLNGVGLFVWGYATLFQPPAGEMTRVVLHGDGNRKSEIRSLLGSASWTYPGSGAIAPAANISATPWQATGVMSDTGRCFEFRLKDGESKKLAAEKDKLEKENSPLVAQEKLLRDQAAIHRAKGHADSALGEIHNADEKKLRIDAITARISSIDADLAGRARNFHAQVLRVLGNRVISEGDQIIGAKIRQAQLLEIASVKRPDSYMLERILDDLRQDRIGIIDLRPLKRDSGYGVSISTILEPGSDEAASADQLLAAVERAAAGRDPGLIGAGRVPVASSLQPTITLDLMVIEEPLDTYVSPITRLVNLVLAVFDRVPSPDRWLSAMARNLRVPTESNHIRAVPGPGPKTISITAVLPLTASKVALEDDLVNKRLQILLGGLSSEGQLAQARALYNRVEKAAAAQRITVAHPTLASAYAPMKYDYMSGYLCMFVMSLIGIGITLAFVRFEAKGLVRKRGVEEGLES